MSEPDNLDRARIDPPGASPAHGVDHAPASGLARDETIRAFGIAAGATPMKASDRGRGTPGQCAARAGRRLKSGMKSGMTHGADAFGTRLGRA